MNWKHNKHGHVVADSCYMDLPEENREEFTETNENPTHTVEMGDDLNEDDSLAFTAIVNNNEQGEAPKENAELAEKEA